jgi:hypothetical protein
MAFLLVAFLLGLAPGQAGAEDEEPAPPAPPASSDPDADACRAEHQKCSAGDGATWCCPLQSTGAHVCCGAVANVCHACDVDDHGVEIPVPKE